MDLGLILGAALAGGAQGGGEAAGKVAATNIDAQNKQDLVKMQADLDYQKQMALQQSQQTFQTGYQQAGFAHDDTTQASNQTFQSARDDKEIASKEKINANDIASRDMNSAAERSVQLTMAGMNNAIAKAHLAMARGATTIISNEAGEQFYSQVNPTGGPPTITPVIDPSTNKTMIGTKNADATKVMLYQSLMAQSKAAEGQMDTKSAADFARQAQGVLTGSIDPKSIGIVQPPQADINILMKNPSQKNIDLFKSHYPGIDPSIYLNPKSVPAANPSGGIIANGAQSTGTPGTMPLPGSGNANAGVVNNAPLQNGNIPQQPTPDDAIAASKAALAQRGTAKPVVAPPAAPYRPSGIIAQAMQPQAATIAPPTQQGIKLPTDAFGQPIQQSPQNPIMLTNGMS